MMQRLSLEFHEVTGERHGAKIVEVPDGGTVHMQDVRAIGGEIRYQFAVVVPLKAAARKASAGAPSRKRGPAAKPGHEDDAPPASPERA